MRPIFLLPLLSLALAAQGAPEAPKPQAPAAAPAQPPSAPAMTPARPMMPTPPAAKPAPIPEDQVIARIGKRLIHEKDFLDWLKVAAGKRFDQVARMPNGLANARNQYLDIQLLAAKARKERLQTTQDFLKMQKVQEDQILSQILTNDDREGSEAQKVKIKAENPTEEEMRAYLEKNAQRFETPEKFTARHLLVGLKGAPKVGEKGLTDDEAKAKIAKIQGELKAGRPFEDLVKEYSDDPGAKASNGLYKDQAYGGFVKEFQDAVRTQELGKVGEPVKTIYGYHLIEVDARTPKQPATFEAAKDRIKQMMLPERKEALRKEFLEKTRKEMDFVAGADAAASLPKAAPAKKAKPAAK